MSYYDDDYGYRSTRDKIAESDAYLRRQGFVRDQYGHYDDPNNVTRTGAYIDPTTGQIHRDM